MCNHCVIENVKKNMLSRRLLFKGAVAGVTAVAAGSLAAPVLAQTPGRVIDLTHTYDSAFPTFETEPSDRASSRSLRPSNTEFSGEGRGSRDRRGPRPLQLIVLRRTYLIGSPNATREAYPR